MNRYRVIIWNDTRTANRELIEVIDMDRRRFTKREYDMVVQSLFYWGASSCVYDTMTAEIYCNGKKVMDVCCKTRQDGSEIRSTILANNEPVRMMTVAA